MRAVIFWSASLLLALWVLAGIGALVDVLRTEGALLPGALAWLAGAVPLAALLIALRRGGG